MSTIYDGTLLDHLAEHISYLSTASSFWFSVNSSCDNEFHLSKRLGIMPQDSSSSHCATLSSSNRAGWLLRRLSLRRRLVLSSRHTLVLSLRRPHVVSSRRLVVAFLWNYLPPPPRRRQAAANVTMSRCHHRRSHHAADTALPPSRYAPPPQRRCQAAANVAQSRFRHRR